MVAEGAGHLKLRRRAGHQWAAMWSPGQRNRPVGHQRFGLPVPMGSHEGILSPEIPVSANMPRAASNELSFISEARLDQTSLV